MANAPEGPQPPASGGYSPLLVPKLADLPYTQASDRILRAFSAWPKTLKAQDSEPLSKY